MKSEKWYLKLAKVLLPFGMVSATLYILHVVLGTMLWPEYSSIADPISLLTADSAPNAAMLRVISSAFGVCQLLFAIGIAITAFSRYGRVIRAGAVCYLAMCLVSLVGFYSFPMADGRQVGLQNSLHTVVNTLVVLLTMVSIYLVSIGFFAFENMRTMGIISLTAAMCIAVFGIAHALMGAQNIPMQGLTERLSTLSYHCYVFFVSFAYTFNIKMVREKGPPQKPPKK